MRVNRWPVFLVLMLAASLAWAGAWGPGNFENDDAMDWLGGAEARKGEAGIRAALRAVLDGTAGEPDAGACSVALAACEVVAAAQGRAAPAAPREIAVASKALDPKAALALGGDARKAIDRILAKSGLRRAWSETDDFPAWRRAVEGLKARLRDGETPRREAGVRAPGQPVSPRSS